MTSSTKPEVRNLSHRRQMRTKPRPQAFGDARPCVFRVTRSDRQANGHTHHNTSHPFWGEVVMLKWSVQTLFIWPMRRVRKSTWSEFGRAENDGMRLTQLRRETSRRDAVSANDSVLHDNTEDRVPACRCSSRDRQ